MSDSEVADHEKQERARLAAEAAMSVNELPQRVRWTNPSTYPQALATCMSDNGVPATPVPGGAEYSIATAQKESARRVQVGCAAQHMMHPYYSRPLSPAAQNKYYDWVASTVKCLRQNGAPTPEVPTREVWIAASRTTVPVLPWDKLNEQSLNRTERERLEQKCPSFPSSTMSMSWLEANPVLTP